MLHITSLSDGLDIFKALGSDVRIEILNILLDNNNMSMNELASRLSITNGALTSHIKKLERDKGWAKAYYEKQLTELTGKLEEYPKRLSLEEQGKFILGYYHQQQKKYEKGEDK